VGARLEGSERRRAVASCRAHRGDASDGWIEKNPSHSARLRCGTRSRTVDASPQRVRDHSRSRPDRRWMAPERRSRESRVYVLVAVRAPDHHGLGVGDLAGGDGDGLGDLSLLGDSGHLCDRCVRLWGLAEDRDASVDRPVAIRAFDRVF
jgi:hypothetical protein